MLIIFFKAKNLTSNLNHKDKKLSMCDEPKTHYSAKKKQWLHQRKGREEVYKVS